MKQRENLKIIKLEKGPLQRFKNQNLLLKKFGEIGLQVYKVITGKRTTEELRSDMELEPALFTDILTYMEEAGMIELMPIEEKISSKVEKKEKETKTVEEKAVREEREVALETIDSWKEGELIEPEIPDETDETVDITKEIKIELEELEEEKEEVSEQIELVSEDESKSTEPRDEDSFDVDGKKDEPEEKIEEVTTELDREIAPEGEKIELEDLDRSASEERQPEEEISPVEKMIKDKYGDVGLRVYELIDGQRTAEEIMKETELSEPKLVEILDFMDAQGIIKLEYPKGKKEEKEVSVPKKEALEVIIDSRYSEEEPIKELSPMNVPIKAPSNIISDVQLKAKTIMKFGEIGSKVLGEITGKNDVVDIAFKIDVPLYKVDAILNFFLQNRAIFLKQLPRVEVRKRYGDEGYSIYKKYGKEGLMLYKLIGKELTIKQMADKITTDKTKVAEMFMFIHQVLRIDLPLDKEILYRQLGI